MNCVGHGRSCHDELLTNHVADVSYSADMVISACEVKMACARLKLGKASGPDGLFSESYRYASDRVMILISMLLTACFVHGILPQDMINSSITPIVKNNNGDVTDYDNYRGLALATSASKILEIIILSRYSNLLETSRNQFGFKSSHGTEDCIFALKEVINFYFDHATTVFACFVDFSKAFDRVKHARLFEKLICRIFQFLLFEFSRFGTLISYFLFVGVELPLSFTLCPMVLDKGVFCLLYYLIAIPMV